MESFLHRDRETSKVASWTSSVPDMRLDEQHKPVTMENSGGVVDGVVQDSGEAAQNVNGNGKQPEPHTLASVVEDSSKVNGKNEDENADVDGQDSVDDSPAPSEKHPVSVAVPAATAAEAMTGSFNAPTSPRSITTTSMSASGRFITFSLKSKSIIYHLPHLIMLLDSLLCRKKEKSNSRNLSLPLFFHKDTFYVQVVLLRTSRQSILKWGETQIPEPCNMILVPFERMV